MASSDERPQPQLNSNGRVVPEFTKLFINNEWVDSLEGLTMDVINPATEEKICSVQRAGLRDVDRAVAAAREAFDNPNSAWRKMSQYERGRLLFRLADLIEQHADVIADLESQDNGKPITFSRNNDIKLILKVYRYYAGWSDKIQGRTIPVEGPYFCYTRQEPVGVAGQIIPWNVPLKMQAMKWAPCVAAGAVSILKTSEKTPLTALYIANLAKQAGFPPGVLQVLSGYGDIGAYLVKHPGVDKIAFTGSTKVGIDIMRNAPTGSLKRVTLELGGKSPNIICHDADIDLAVKQAIPSLFLNQGQVCCQGSRLFVHEQVYDEFVEKYVQEAQKIKIGDPFSKETQQGPQVDDIQFNFVMKYIALGKEEGAKCLVGGERWGDKGYFIKPTVFTEVQDSMTIVKEEIFGPVICILKFSTYDEVIKRANDTQYGLAAGIVTKSIETYQKIANSLRVGTVWVNCYYVQDTTTPSGGYKMSGLGREMGEDCLRLYLEPKTVIVKMSNDTLP